MAWIFSLSAECGLQREAAKKFATYFEAVSWVLSNGVRSQCRTIIFQDIDESWWCRVIPSGVGEIGIEAPDSAYLVTESGILLYQHLRAAPDFRYALAGLEVDEFRTFDELLSESFNLSFPGLVLSDTTWQSIESPLTLRTFSPGYVWQPYEGEIYKPLMVSPALKEQMNRLLAA